MRFQGYGWWFYLAFRQLNEITLSIHYSCWQRDASRLFYETLHRQIPSSCMARNWYPPHHIPVKSLWWASNYCNVNASLYLLVWYMLVIVSCRMMEHGLLGYMSLRRHLHTSRNGSSNPRKDQPATSHLWDIMWILLLRSCSSQTQSLEGWWIVQARSGEQVVAIMFLVWSLGRRR